MTPQHLESLEKALAEWKNGDGTTDECNALRKGFEAALQAVGITAGECLKRNECQLAKQVMEEVWP